ncbi:methyltransferase domain-containing protein [Rhodobacteraceae bacterium RKSG542]|nr:methyltransferase domain-containing protein [Pseudovibrio flavus]
MLPNRIFDRALLKKRREKALQNKAEGIDFLLRVAAEEVADRLSLVTRQFDTGVDLGGHSGLVTEVLQASGKVTNTIRADVLAADNASGTPDLVCDDGALPFADQSIDLLVSTLQLHLLDDLPGSLVQIRRALKPDGLFLAGLFGSGTLKELRDSLLAAEMKLSGGVSPRVAPFADLRDMGALLQRAGFALPVVDSETITVRYDTLFDLMRDLQAMGAANPLSDRKKTLTSKTMLLEAAKHYAENFSDDDGRIRATFSFIWLSGWAPHESQQKPLRPGSAKTSLAEALGTKEKKL